MSKETKQNRLKQEDLLSFCERVRFTYFSTYKTQPYIFVYLDIINDNEYILKI